MKTTQKYGKNADLALSLLVKLVRATDTLAMLTAKDIERYGLTPSQFGIFESLGHLGPMKIGEICSKKLMSGGNTTVVIDNLEKLNIVERVKDSADRRASIIRLTKKGQNLFNKTFVQHAKYVEELICRSLTEEEIIQLSELLKKLGTTLKTKL
ncbi:MAG: MarR family transcriptional regulator [Bacteroidetes bacterium]|nr:MarR family transcriptional regulator [Bacteroidota bacterium]